VQEQQALAQYLHTLVQERIMATEFQKSDKLLPDPNGYFRLDPRKIQEEVSSLHILLVSLSPKANMLAMIV
jgi:hypothetical protein